MFEVARSPVNHGFHAVVRMAPLPQRFAADAHECIMVPVFPARAVRSPALRDGLYRKGLNRNFRTKTARRDQANCDSGTKACPMESARRIASFHAFQGHGLDRLRLRWRGSAQLPATSFCNTAPRTASKASKTPLSHVSEGSTGDLIVGDRVPLGSEGRMRLSTVALNVSLDAFAATCQTLFPWRFWRGWRSIVPTKARKLGRALFRDAALRARMLPTRLA